MIIEMVTGADDFTRLKAPLYSCNLQLFTEDIRERLQKRVCHRNALPMNAFEPVRRELTLWEVSTYEFRCKREYHRSKEYGGHRESLVWLASRRAKSFPTHPRFSFDRCMDFPTDKLSRGSSVWTGLVGTVHGAPREIEACTSNLRYLGQNDSFSSKGFIRCGFRLPALCRFISLFQSLQDKLAVYTRQLRMAISASSRTSVCVASMQLCSHVCDNLTQASISFEGRVSFA